jgi:hypothetical protein
MSSKHLLVSFRIEGSKVGALAQLMQHVDNLRVDPVDADDAPVGDVARRVKKRRKVMRAHNDGKTAKDVAIEHIKGLGKGFVFRCSTRSSLGRALKQAGYASSNISSLTTTLVRAGMLARVSPGTVQIVNV